MTAESTIERITRNNGASAFYLCIMLACAGVIINASIKVFTEKLPTLKFILAIVEGVAASVAFFTMGLILSFSSFTLKGNTMKKTLAYSISAAVVVAIEMFVLISETTGPRRTVSIIGAVCLTLLLICQTVGFSVSQENGNVFHCFKPFHTEIFTIVPLSKDSKSGIIAPSTKPAAASAAATVHPEHSKTGAKSDAKKIEKKKENV